MPINESNSRLAASEATRLQSQNLSEHNQELKNNNKGAPGKLDPQKLFDLVSKNYDTWLQVMSKQFKDEENFLPFPKDDAVDKNSQPIFNYTLLEALEKASSDFSEKMNEMNTEGSSEKIAREEKESNGKLRPKANQESCHTKEPSKNAIGESLLKESEINFLRNKITQMIASNNFSINNNYKVPKSGGFSLYDTQDEEGLHDGNTDQFYDDDQDDYDLEEAEGDFLYDYPGSHHIEVELNTGSECKLHGFEECDCPIFHGEKGGEFHNGAFDEDEDGPSCEFTFEYDHKGKLVPTYSNVEEKLRLMNLESRISAIDSRSLKLPSINEINTATTQNVDKASLKNKRKNKKKKGSKQATAASDSNHPSNVHNSGSGACCLFCEYEVIYGSKPRQMIKWYDQRVRREEQRRLEIKKKLENAKLKALRKQRDLRQKQLQQANEAHSYSHKTENNPISSDSELGTRLDTLDTRLDNLDTRLDNLELNDDPK